MNLDELLGILKVGSFNGKEFVCTYGTGRIETYSIDKHSMSGYDSSGNYKIIDLDSDDFDINELRTLSEVTQVWKKDK